MTCLDKLVHFIIEKPAKGGSFEMKKYEHTEARALGVPRRVGEAQNSVENARKSATRSARTSRLVTLEHVALGKAK